MLFFVVFRMRADEPSPMIRFPLNWKKTKTKIFARKIFRSECGENGKKQDGAINWVYWFQFDSVFFLYSFYLLDLRT